MRRLNTLRQKWDSQSLAIQFLLAGGLVSIVAAMIVGFLVTSQIEEGVTRNSAATSALYVDSVIAPLLPDMRKSTTLPGTVARALDETLSQGALGDRLVSFKLWRRDGTILYAKDKSLVGLRFEPSRELQAAWQGQMVAEFNRLDDLESAAEKAQGRPLLEIYNPVLQPWSGEVVAVSEFYEIATDFEKTLQAARLWSWLAVAAETLVVFTLLSAIVFRGSRMIDMQSKALKERVTALSELLAQNRRLRLRAQQASQRVTALNERYLRRIGADLHDGPAQLVAYAALRLDSDIVAGQTDIGEPQTPRDPGHQEQSGPGDARHSQHLHRPCPAAYRGGGTARHIAACRGRARAADGPSSIAHHHRARRRAAFAEREDLRLSLRAGGAQQFRPPRRRCGPGDRPAHRRRKAADRGFRPGKRLRS